MRRFHHHESEIADWRTASPIVPLPFFAVLRGTVDLKKKKESFSEKDRITIFSTMNADTIVRKKKKMLPPSEQQKQHTGCLRACA